MIDRAIEKTKISAMMQTVIEIAAKFAAIEKDESLPVSVRSAAIAAQGGMARLGREVLELLKAHS